MHIKYYISQKKYYHLLDTKTTKVTVDTLRQNTNFVNLTMSKKKSAISGVKIEPKNSTSKICLVKIKMVQKSQLIFLVMNK